MRNIVKRLVKFLPLTGLLFLLLAWPGKTQTQSTYFYVAVAVDSNGAESIFSNQVSEAIATIVAAPNKSVVLTWNASSSTGVVGYNVYRSTASGSLFVKINSTPIVGLTYTDVYVPPNPPTGLAGAIK